jgi:hypothetical protein
MLGRRSPVVSRLQGVWLREKTGMRLVREAGVRRKAFHAVKFYTRGSEELFHYFEKDKTWP